MFVCVLAAALALYATACNGEKAKAQSAVTSKQAVTAVTAFDPANLRLSVSRLNEASFGKPDLTTSLAPLLRSPVPNRRWAAVYLTSLLVDRKTAAILKPVLDDRSEANRVLAAGALAHLGVVESLPVLVEGLSSEELLPFHEVPTPAASLAERALRASTGRDFATPAEWRAWWADSKASIHWDGARFVVS